MRKILTKVLTAASISALAIFGVAAAPSSSLASDIERTYPHPDNDGDADGLSLMMTRGEGTDAKQVLKQSATRTQDPYPDPGHDDDADDGALVFAGADRMSDRTTAGIDK